MGDGLEKITFLAFGEITGIATGFDHSCAWSAKDPNDQKIQCWGSNKFGALGSSDSTLSNFRNIPVPVILPAP